MGKWTAVVVALLAGVVAGLVLAKFLGERAPRRDAPALAPIAVAESVEQLSSREAEAQRADRYAEIASIADMLRLPTEFARNEALFALAGRSDAAGLEPLIRAAAGIETNHERHVALQILFSRYTELDPIRAVAFAQRLDIGGHRLAFIEEIFSAWAKVDLNAALGAVGALHSPVELQAAGNGVLRAYEEADETVRQEILARLPAGYRAIDVRARTLAERAARTPLQAAREALTLTDRAERQTALRGVAYAWAQQDPQAALAFAESIGDMQTRWHFQYTAIRRWAQADAEAALAVLQEMPRSQRNSQMISTVLAEFANQDPLRALEVARGLRGAGSRRDREQSVYNAWAQNDFASAWAHAERISSAAERDDIRQAMVQRLAWENPAAAIAWAATADAAEYSQLVEEVLRTAAAQAPDAALNYVATIENEQRRNQMLTSVLFQVARTKPELAVDYLDTLPAGSRAHVIQTIALGKAQADVNDAIAWAESLRPHERTLALQGVMNRWAQSDPEAARRYVEQLDAGERAKHVNSVASGLAQRDPQRAFEWVIGLGGGDDSRAAISIVAQAWSQQDPRAAAQWAARLPEGAVKRDVMTGVIGQWARYDVHAASAWVETLRGEARDGAVASLAVNQALSTDRALDLVNSVRDDALRFQALSQLVIHSIRDDPAAIDVILRRANVTPAQRDALARLPGQPN